MDNLECLMQILYYIKSIYLLVTFSFFYLVIKQVYNFFAHFIFGRCVRNIIKFFKKGGVFNGNCINIC